MDNFIRKCKSSLWLNMKLEDNTFTFYSTDITLTRKFLNALNVKVMCFARESTKDETHHFILHNSH